jgi:hypothetical protein
MNPCKWSTRYIAFLFVLIVILILSQPEQVEQAEHERMSDMRSEPDRMSTEVGLGQRRFRHPSNVHSEWYRRGRGVYASLTCNASSQF